MKDYQTWLAGLKPGDPVLIRHPWEERDVPGGRLEPATVTAILPNGILVEGQGVFHGKTGKHSPYECLEPPDYTPPVLPTPVLPKRVAASLTYWKKRDFYSHAFALRVSERGVLLCRFLTRNDFFTLYAWTVDGFVLPIGGAEIGRAVGTAALLIEAGTALYNLATAAEVGELALMLKKIGFTVIYEGRGQA